MASWLATQANALLNLEQAQLESKDLLALANALGTLDAEKFLDRLSKGVEEKLEELSQEQLDRLRQWYEKKLAENEDINNLRALFGKVGDICEKDGVQHTKTLAWPLETQAAGGVDEIRLNLSFSSQVGLNLVACADLPERAGKMPVGQAALLISVAGQVNVNSGAALPIGRLAVSGNAAAKGKLQFDYYSLHDRDSQPLAAVVSGFRQLGASPFDLAALSLQLQNGLRCVSLSGEGEISLGGRVALASPFSLAKKMTLAEMAYGYSASLSGAFNYHIQADTEESSKVTLFLNRTRGDSRTRESGVKIGLDMESTLARIRQETLPFLGKAEGLLAKADDLLQPGKRLRSELQEALAGLDTESGKLLSPLLESLLGFKPGRAPVDAISEALSQKIQALGLDLNERTLGQAGPLLDQFLAGLGIPSEQRESLREKMEARLDQALEKIRSSTEEKLGELTSGAKAKDIAKALEQVGLKVQTGLSDMDQRLAGMRQLIQRYRSIANDIMVKLGDATAAKLTASLGLVNQQQQTAGADLVLRFDPLDAAARQAFREVLLGSFEHALELARNGQSGVEVLDCHLGRMVSNRQGADFEVAVLGFVLTRGSLLETSTVVELDASGNLTLISRAAVAKYRGLFREKRSLRIADVFEVMAAGKTHSLKFDVTLSHEDDKLKPGELEDFLGSLAAAKLLAPERVREANATLQHIRSTTPNCLNSGRVDVRLALEGNALETLMGMGMDANAYLSTVWDTAEREMKYAYIANLTNEGLDPKDVLKKVSKYYGISNTWAKVIDELDDKVFTSGEVGHGHQPMREEWTYGRRINHIHNLREELHLALGALRDLYQIDAGEMEKMKNPAYCQEKQEAIMLYAKGGMPAGFPSLFGKESIDPETVALFRILAQLSGRKLDGTDIVEVTLTLCGGNEKQVRRIA
jgi:hypothetical protein